VFDKTVVITGATSGIGEVAALHLAEQGARIVLVARDPSRAQATLARLKVAGPRRTHGVYIADLSTLGEQRRAGAEIAAAESRIDVLINNAGAMLSRGARSADGLALTFATNHLAYYTLTLLLLPRLRATPRARIVCTSSRAHVQGYMDFDHLQRDGYSGYAQSKLANLLFVRELSRRLAGQGPTVNALHPGFVATRFGDGGNLAMRTLMRGLKSIAGISAESGAKTLIYLAQSEEMAGRSGGYYVRCAPAGVSARARSDADAARLWQISAQLTGLDLEPAASPPPAS
jgi:NAD(P)-dependent dehydrogenase (short-subunit alcohol dehydrogenase family)